jgi:antitoxin component YwqK of YwqJK toxin-antitoxin module
MNITELKYTKKCNIYSLSYYLRSIKKLHPDIIANVLSDYIDYDSLIQLCKYCNDFKINPARVQIKETINENIIKEIYIDGDLRTSEIFNKDNTKILEHNHKNGEFEGKQYEWYENGQLKYEMNYKNGKLEGPQYGWYENGQLKYEMNYKNRQKEGKQYKLLSYNLAPAVLGASGFASSKVMKL